MELRRKGEELIYGGRIIFRSGPRQVYNEPPRCRGIIEP
jgi:hypothetical protein